jgi:hypothetical protein
VRLTLLKIVTEALTDSMPNRTETNRPPRQPYHICKDRRIGRSAQKLVLLPRN